MDITKNEGQLKEMMFVSDGYSAKNIKKRSSLREPEDDVALAKLLVQDVLARQQNIPGSVRMLFSR